MRLQNAPKVPVTIREQELDRALALRTSFLYSGASGDSNCNFRTDESDYQALKH
jgi:hypothetical protein